MEFAQKTAVIGLFALGAASMAYGAEYCVKCVAPDVTYACEVGAPGSKSDPRAWLLCITELARTGGHESCSVERNAPVPCPGVRKALAGPEGPPVGEPPVEAAAPPPAPVTPEPVEPTTDKPDAPKKPPRTVEELASETYDASKEGIKKAGESVSETAKKAGEAVSGTAKSAGDTIGEAGSAVSGAAKKSWNCLTSLFKDC